MLRRITLGAAAAALTVAGFAATPASAGHEGGACDILVAYDLGGQIYADVRSNGDQWIYQETNGNPGLQRGGSGGITGLSANDGHCFAEANPDLILY